MSVRTIAKLAGAMMLIAVPALADQWSGVLGPVFSSITSDFPNGGAYPAAGVTLDYFQCSRPQGAFLTPFASPQCGAIAGPPNLLNISQFASQSEFDSMNNQVSRLEVTLSEKAWSGAALAAALTPVLPTDGNTNRFGVGFATMAGYAAFSLNYEHVMHDVDFGVGLATTGKYGIAKLNVGISW